MATQTKPLPPNVYPASGSWRYRGRFRAQQASYYVGTFDTPEEAAEAVKAKKAELAAAGVNLSLNRRHKDAKPSAFEPDGTLLPSGIRRVPRVGGDRYEARAYLGGCYASAGTHATVAEAVAAVARVRAGQVPDDRPRDRRLVDKEAGEFNPGRYWSLRLACPVKRIHLPILTEPACPCQYGPRIGAWLARLEFRRSEKRRHA